MIPGGKSRTLVVAVSAMLLVNFKAQGGNGDVIIKSFCL